MVTFNVRIMFSLCVVFVLSALSVGRVEAKVELDMPYLFDYQAEQTLPDAFTDVPRWMSGLTEAKSVALTGGQYWMVSPVLVDNRSKQWVINARNSIVESVDYYVFGSDGSRQIAHSGYNAPYDFLFDYGRQFTLTAGVDYWLVVKLSSRYYSSAPQLELSELSEHERTADLLAMAVLLCLGGLMFIAFYNLLIYVSTKDKAFFYYGLYVMTYFGGWAFTFHLPSHYFGFHQLELHHLFFISLPIFNIMFYKYFLQLPSYSPRLWRLSQYLMWACVLALPTSIWLLSYTAIIASVLIMLWIALAITCGNVCLMKGFSPARYFILAFSCLLLPAVIILPGNMGITPDFIEYAELATLMGGTADALLLSLALANKLKILSEERRVYIDQLNVAWEAARRDPLTQISNRFAFDEYMNGLQSFGSDADHPMTLAIIDVDGLKAVNDSLGHQEGDRQLKALVEYLLGLSLTDVKLYRISGDEFALLLPSEQLTLLVEALDNIRNGYVNEGLGSLNIHYGFADNTQVSKSHEWLRLADSQMYKNKIEKRRANYAHSRALEG